MTTLKIKYEFEKADDRELFKAYLTQFASGYHFVYNRMREGVAPREIHKMLENLNNLELLDSWFIENLFKASDMMIKSENARDKEENKPAVFGGKKNLLRRQKNLITKE